jgi:anti-sigma regulatory factor (Ser/Thr protein kinase)
VAVVQVEAVDEITDHFHHEAFIYRDDDEYLEYLVPFVSRGLDLDEAVLIAVPEARLGLLQDHLGAVSDAQIRFAAMEDLGKNPAWIIPVWAAFIKRSVADGRGVRAIGEPTWPGRSSDEMTECVRHEALLNLAFADALGFRLACPYDGTHLDPAVIADAHRTHPQVSRSGAVVPSNDYIDAVPVLLDTPLSPVPATARRVEFDGHCLTAVRNWAAEMAVSAGLTGGRVDDLMVAISEGTTNSVRHGGGSGELWVWSAGHEVLCEIRDVGRLADPLAGRIAPGVHQLDGRGLWIMNQVSDLLQMRTVPAGQAIRLHFAI